MQGDSIIDRWWKGRDWEKGGAVREKGREKSKGKGRLSSYSMFITTLTLELILGY